MSEYVRVIRDRMAGKSAIKARGDDGEAITLQYPYDMRHLSSFTFEVLSETGEGVVNVKVAAHKAFSIGCQHYKVNELVGVQYTLAREVLEGAFPTAIVKGPAMSGYYLYRVGGWFGVTRAAEAGVDTRHLTVKELNQLKAMGVSV